MFSFNFEHQRDHVIKSIKKFAFIQNLQKVEYSSRVLFVNSKIISKLRYQLAGFKIWGNNATKIKIDKILI